MTVKLTASSSAQPYSSLALTLRTGPGKAQIGIPHHNLGILGEKWRRGRLFLVRDHGCGGCRTVGSTKHERPPTRIQRVSSGHGKFWDIS